ncbi:MAG: carbamoyltransferase HypF [Nitrospira sp.]|nr:carbamoyltransferase HypF [Nitrospira sp.]
MNETLAQRVRIDVDGTVQGVGFRPFVYRLAHELELSGWVSNTVNGVSIEVEGGAPTIETFLRRLKDEAPASACVDGMRTYGIPVQDDRGFAIHRSTERGRPSLVIPPDLATCSDCLRELADSSDRRFRYPFLTCTQCGPRYSLLTAMPYERSYTTMGGFPLCVDCLAEYETESDRRFHAEQTACSACGPYVRLWDEQGYETERGEEALLRANALLCEGLVVAVKALGGFQLWVDAGSEEAVRRLRARKQRPDKPYAVLFPSIDAVHADCVVSADEEAILRSPQAPIVLVRKRSGAQLAESVAPGNPYIGAMLPATPLHHLLMQDLQRPMVATSGNRAEEPIVIDEREAVIRLKGIADAFLIHDRPIARPVDDSVVRVVPAGSQARETEQQDKLKAQVIMLRRARGYAPQAIRLENGFGEKTGLGSVLAVGGHLKNTVALLREDRVWLSQHLGDLSTLEADAAFRQAVGDLQRLLKTEPQLIACDLHPDYRSSRFARELASSLSVPLVPVQHHHAHVASCMAEHGLDGEVLGIAWDGAGYGTDGQVWGGEFLIAGYQRFRRFAHLRPFRLLGGEAAMKEPRRSAAAVLWEIMGERMPGYRLPSWEAADDQRAQFAALLRSGLASPWTTSMGRLFDAVASLTGLCRQPSFEGQAAMAVEFAAERAGGHEASFASGYSVDLVEPDSSGGTRVVDWRPMVSALLDDLRRGCNPEQIAARFHVGLAAGIVCVAQAAGLPRVVLTGGCFQNGLLLSFTRQRLEEAGFAVYSHSLVPSNDGGLSLGQAVIAARISSEEQSL